MSGKHAKQKRKNLQESVDNAAGKVLKGIGDVMTLALAERVMADPGRIEGGLDAFKRGTVRLELTYSAEAGGVKALARAVDVETGEVLFELFRYPPAG